MCRDRVLIEGLQRGVTAFGNRITLLATGESKTLLGDVTPTMVSNLSRTLHVYDSVNVMYGTSSAYDDVILQSSVLDILTSGLFLSMLDN